MLDCKGYRLSMYTFQEAFYHLPTLFTARLRIRPARMSDAQDLFDYSRDPEVARYVLWDAHKSIHQTRAHIRFLLKQYRSGQPGSFVIELARDSRVIGTIGFMWYHQENRSAEIGYSLGRAYWNQGIMSEALRAVLQFGFETLHLNRIEAQHESDNPASGRVMAHVGMRHEGHLRQRIYNKGRYADVELYAILREDFSS
ncbi:MAG: GNAT family N-acetyltransferase [Clostridia bacterium]|nr:GNAT family N-acetyltransferase [Clostridia bacterium]